MSDTTHKSGNIGAGDDEYTPTGTDPSSQKDGGVADAWDRYIAPAGWLDVFREAAAIAFCQLWDEFQTWPARFPASKHAQMRAYMGDLALLGPGRTP